MVTMCYNIGLMNPASTEQTQPIAPVTQSKKQIPFVLIVVAVVVIGIIYAFAQNFNQNNASLTSDSVEMAFTDKNYTLNPAETYASTKSLEIAGFEESERWTGTYNLDDGTYMDGNTSMNVVSRDGQTSVVSLAKSIDLTGYTTISMLGYIAKADALDGLQTLQVRFTTKDGDFVYPIVSIKQGWNVFKMPLDQFVANKAPAWDKIESVSVEVTSRANARTEINLDRMWAENNSDYKDDFKMGNQDFLSVKTIAGKTYLQGWPIGSSNALIKKITSVKNFSYTAKLVPEKRGEFGINFRYNSANGFGYFFTMDGVDTGTWRLYKYGTPSPATPATTYSLLAKGMINNYTVELNKPIWMRAVTDGSRITVSISNDGSSFVKLASMNNSELKSGGIGFVSGANVLLEQVSFVNK